MFYRYLMLYVALGIMHAILRVFYWKTKRDAFGYLLVDVIAWPLIYVFLLLSVVFGSKENNEKG